MFRCDCEIERNWSRDVKDILHNINMQERFVKRRVYYLNNVESKWIDLNKSVWLNSIPLKPKLRTYKNYKLEMQTEDYVKYCLTRKRFSDYFSIRIGILPPC